MFLQAHIQTQLAPITPAPSEAQTLLCHILQITPIQLKTTTTLTEAQTQTLQDLINRRLNHEPLAYLLGQAPFWSHDWHVTPHTLIPRPDSEILLLACLNLINQITHSHGVTPGHGWAKPALYGGFGVPSPSPGLPLSASSITIAEIGTGSGCLIGSILHENPTLTAIATDLSPQALQVANQNLHTIGVAQRCQLIHTNLLDDIAGPFHLILSNPPYISEPEYNQLDPSVKNHEPALALVAGADGLAVYRPLILQAAEKLHSGGWLALEIGWQQREAVTTLLQQAKNTWTNIQCHPDLAQRPRTILAQRC